ncbi:SpoVR family protein [Myxococcota bacterium]|nr:SpoVR family protein [Myxococcota bacterium]
MAGMGQDLFDIRYRRGLPGELKALQAEVRAHAKEVGLDFFEVVFELLDYQEMSMLAAYGGFPTRYPHWRFGMEYEQLSKGYAYGLQKIYEMVINTDPCYAYLLNCNMMTDQKLVMAHVYAHCDFFKNNLFFAHTNRRMIDEMANHATRVRRYVDRYGQEKVESFIDTCLSVENLIDPHGSAIRRRPDRTDPPVPREDGEDGDDDGETDLPQAAGFKLRSERSYMDSYINPPGIILKQQEEAWKASQEPPGFPEAPERDVLRFILENAPLRGWEQDVLEIVRKEALYFAPQAQTKIMNEGWATFWHTRMMTGKLATGAEIVDYADHHSGTVAMSPGSLNPYKLGVELLRDVEERWNKGRHGKEWEECDDAVRRGHWDTGDMAGLQKVFEVRKVYNDLLFIDTFLTEDFCRRQGFFTYGFNKTSNLYEIESRDFQKVKQKLLFMLTNAGQPRLVVTDGNHANRGELYMKHLHEGIELKRDWAITTLGNVARLWRRPVNLETVLDGKKVLYRHDGKEYSQKFVG